MDKNLKKLLALAVAVLIPMGSFGAAAAEGGVDLTEQPPVVSVVPIENEEPTPAPEATEAPATDEPAPEVTEAPATEEPAPEATEAPATEEPAPEATEAPAAETPAPEATEAPATEEPAPEVTEAPATEEPAPVVTEAPATEEPAPEATEAPVVGMGDDCPAVDEDADIRKEPDGLSEILLTIPAGTRVAVHGVEGDWIKVAVADVEGYIHKDSMLNVWESLQPGDDNGSEENEECPIKVTIFSSRRSTMEPGETITLTSKIEGSENYETVLQWQCDKGSGFENVAGANEDHYSFAASIESLSYSWRLVVYYR